MSQVITTQTDQDKCKGCNKNFTEVARIIMPDRETFYDTCKKCLERLKRNQRAREKRAKIPKCKWIFPDTGKPCAFKEHKDIKNGYCGNHQRCGKIKDGKDQGFNFCSDEKRCETRLPDDYPFDRCLECRIKEREREKKLREKIKNTPNKIEDGEEKQLCIGCNTFKPLIEGFKIKDGSDSDKCKECLDKQTIYELTRERTPMQKRLKDYKNCCTKEDRKKTWELTDEQARYLFLQYCYFCGQKGMEDSPIGIDRIDNDIRKYNEENSVPCCTMCNMMKGTHTEMDFINMCEHITSYNDDMYDGDYYPQLFKNPKDSTYLKYKIWAEKRKKTFDISEEEFNNEIIEDCTYCGHGNSDSTCKNGIDRMDNNIGYTSNNITSCCTTCNFLKRDYSICEFLGKCNEIILHFNSNDIQKNRTQIYNFLILKKGLCNYFNEE